MTMLEPKTFFKVGDRVVLTADSGAAARYPGVWTVTKINPRTIGLAQTVEGRTRQLRCDAWALVHHPATHPADAPTRPGTLTEVPIPVMYDLGQIVRLRGKPGLWVVVKWGADKVNCAKLGGDAGRYYRCPPAMLTKVSVVDAAEELLEALTK